MALIDKLSAIGNAIREKTGKDDLLTLDQMPTEIQAIETGGGDLPEEGLIITGNCKYKFYLGGWDWFINTYGNKITTENITNMNSMFYGSQVEEIPFELNGTLSSSMEIIEMFSGCRYLKSVPKINNIKPGGMSKMFQQCYRLKEIPDDIDANWDWSYIENNTFSRPAIFYDCYSLRKYPNSFLNHGKPSSSTSSSIYTNLFCNCMALDEIIDLPMIYTESVWTSSGFGSNFIDGCSRLKNFTFALQEDGSPYSMKWSNQMLNFSNYVGYVKSTSSILNYNSGITEATRIVDDESYQLLKDHPDSWTTDVAYSRYNKESAIRTIASLPDCSAASGTNTIKFKGPAGSKTDGGAINTLDGSQLAVATAKNWTIAFVS